MKKVLLAFDGAHYSKGAFDLARRLNDVEPVLLIGAFLPHIDFNTSWNYAYGGGTVYIPLLEGVDTDIVNENIDRFEKDCIHHNLEYRVHRNFSDYALHELKKESRFADLMILGSQKFYENLGLETPNEYLRDALHDAECPVIVTPEMFNYPKTVILAYDGSASSVFAIKNFSYLFPELCDAETTLIYAEKKAGHGIPDEDYIKELAARHYSNLTFYHLEEKPGEGFQEWISGVKDPILVTGAFGRSGFSQIFRSSFAANIITEHELPVFIAHH